MSLDAFIEHNAAALDAIARARGNGDRLRTARDLLAEAIGREEVPPRPSPPAVELRAFVPAPRPAPPPIPPPVVPPPPAPPRRVKLRRLDRGPEGFEPIVFASEAVGMSPAARAGLLAQWKVAGSPGRDPTQRWLEARPDPATGLFAVLEEHIDALFRAPGVMVVRDEDFVPLPAEVRVEVLR